ncbi:MAG TPA: hypothetical protein VGD16_04710 [Enterovirga sp.]
MLTLMRLLLAATAVTLLMPLSVQADDRTECTAGISKLRNQVAANPPADKLKDLQATLRKAEAESRRREFDDCVRVLKTSAGGGEAKDHDDYEGPETEDMFGFTTGTDVLDKGKFELSAEAIGSFGKREGRYRIGSLKNTLAFAPLEGLSIEIGVISNGYSVQGVPGLDDRSGAGFGGLSAEVKYRLVKRTEATPVGVTFIVEPGLRFRNDEGERGSGLGIETRLAFDTALVKDKIFAGLNLIYEAEKFRPRQRILFNAQGEPIEGPPSCATGNDESCPVLSRRAPAERESEIGISGALAFQAFQNVFLGGEVRYMRAYEGLRLQRYEGNAVFIGPTFYAKLSEQITISAAFSTQVAGRSVDSPDRSLDLDNFSRHQAKLKVSYEF